MSNRFTVHTATEQTQILAQNLPSGDFWKAKHDTTTNLYSLLYAMGLELMRFEGKLNDTYDELHITNCQNMITDWETEYGMVGGCFDDAIRNGTLAERITNILIKISADGTSTAEQFEALALAMGEEINVYAGDEAGIFTFPFTFPIKFLTEGERKERFTIFIEWVNQVPSVFPLTFPIIFGTLTQGIITCFFEKLKPANCKIVYIN